MENPKPELYSDLIGPVRRNRPDQLYLIRIEAVPADDNPEAEQVAGGYANCWIDVDELRDAEMQALEAIQREGWRPHRFNEWQLLNREDCRDEKGVESFDEALENGQCITIYTWDSDERDLRGHQETERTV